MPGSSENPRPARAGAPADAAAPGRRVDAALHPRRFLAVASAAFAVLLALNLVSATLYYATDIGWVRRAARVFLFYFEASFPMLLNYGLLLANVVFLLVATIRAFGLGDPWRRLWLGAAGVFVFLAYDEATQFHGALIPVARAFLRSREALLVGLVAAGGVVLLLAAVACIRFLLALPRRSAVRFVVAGGVYLAGAIGFDLFAADDAVTNDERATARFLLLATAEESFELIGLILFGYALLRFLARPDGKVGVHIDV